MPPADPDPESSDEPQPITGLDGKTYQPRPKPPVTEVITPDELAELDDTAEHPGRP